MIKVVKDHFGSKKTDPVRVIEFTIKDAFDLFVKKIHCVKTSTPTFENYWSKNIRLKRDARHLVSCCQYQVNIDNL